MKTFRAAWAGALTSNSHKGIDGNRLRVLRQGGQLVNEPHPVLGALPQPNDTPRAHTDTCLSYTLQGIKSVLHIE